MIASWLAGRKKNACYAFGESLYLTSHRLLHVPAPMERALGLKAWWILREHIADVDIIDPSLKNFLIGRVRNLVKIEIRGGLEEIFVVYRPSETTKEIRSWIYSESGL